MTGWTHAAAGVAILWIIPPKTPIELLVGVFLGYIGGTLPDIDAQKSLLSMVRIFGFRPLLRVSAVVSRTFGHRGVVHAWPGLLFATMLSWAFVPIPYVGSYMAASFLLGFMSHLALDACTVSGIRLLYPYRKNYWLLPKFLRFRTTKEIAGPERMVFVLLCLAVLWLVLQTAFDYIYYG